MFKILINTIVQACTVISVLDAIYPTTQELYTINLNQLFKGENLYYSCDHCPIQVFNYLTLMTSSASLGISLTQVEAVPLQFAFNAERLALLTQSSTSQISVQIYNYSFSGGLLKQYDIYQSNYPMTCNNIVYTAMDIIADCYSNNQLIFNAISTTSIPVFKLDNFTQPLYSKLVYFKETLILGQFLGTPNSTIYVFQCKYNIPYMLSDTLAFPHLNITDFAFQDNQTIYVLNYTKVILTFNLVDSKLEFIRYIYLNPTEEVKQLGITLFISQKLKSTVNVFVATNVPIANIYEYTVHDEFFISSVYRGPALAETKVQFQVSEQFLIINQNGLQAYFSRGESLIEAVIDTIVQDILFESRIKDLLIFLNPIYSLVVYAAPKNISLYYLSLPQIIGFFPDQNGTMKIDAGSLNVSKNCSVTLNYTIVSQYDSNIYAATQQYQLPSTSLYPKNTTIELNQMFSGPLIQAEGSTNGSQIIQTTYTNLWVFLHNYPPTVVTYAKNLYNPFTDTLVQILVQNTVIYGYSCENYNNLYCIDLFLDTNASVPITQVEMAFPTIENYNLVYAYDQGQNSIYVSEARLLYANGSLSSVTSQLGAIILMVNGVPLNYTQFTLIGDRLYVVISSIFQIWVYDVFSMGIEPTSIISALEFEGPFMPIQVIGDFTLYGQTLFINNQLNYIILEYDKHEAVLIAYQDNQISDSNVQTTLNLIGNNLIVTQTNSTLQMIVQWLVQDLQKPVWVKQLPLFEQINLDKPIMSDSLFLYVSMQNKIVVYYPYATYHDCLYQELQLEYDYFSTSSSYIQSFIVYGQGNIINNSLLLANPTLVFEPGYYSESYAQQVNYTITVSNPFGGNTYQFNQNMTIYNSQLQIQTIENPNLTFSLTKSGPAIFLLPQLFTGDIEEYYVTCDTCNTSVVELKITNHLEKSVQKIGNLSYVQQIASCEPLKGALVQNTSGIFFVNYTYEVIPILNFTSPNKECYVLTYDQYLSNILTICNPVGTANMSLLQYSFNISTLETNLIVNATISGLDYIQQADLIYNTLIGIGYRNSISSNQIFLIQVDDYVVNMDRFMCLSGVLDYEIVPLYTINNSTGQYLVTNLMYTCANIFQLYYETILFTNQTYQQQNRPQNIQFTLYNVFKTSQFQQVQLLSLDNITQTITLLATSNEVMSFIFNVSFVQEDIVATFIPLINLTIISTIPPYGTFKQVNTLSIQGGLLALSFYLLNENAYLNMLSVYNLKEITNPLLMIGGIYLTPTQGVLNQQYQILPSYNETTTILLTEYFVEYNLGSIIIQPTIELLVNATEPFGTRNITIGAENYFTKQYQIFSLEYPMLAVPSAFPWWGWLIILLALVLGGMCITIVCVRCKANASDEDEGSEFDQDYEELEL